MLEKYVGRIFGEVSPFLPQDWEKLAMRGIVREGSYEFVFYVRQSGSEQYRQCYALANDGLFSRDALRAAFARLYEICLESKNEKEEFVTDPWVSFTLLISHGGNFEIFYEYTDPITCLSSEWKEKYLK